MFTREELLYWSDFVYGMLLSLYPTRFRRHFQKEMVQIFRDCCGSEAEMGNLLAFWLRTVQDLSLSLVVEWRQEIERPQSEIDYTGLVDLFMISVVVGTNLIGWGSFGAAIFLHEALPGLMEYWSSTAAILVCLVTLGFAGLIGTLLAVIVARTGRTNLPHIKV
jgi:hypothetical protein